MATVEELGKKVKAKYPGSYDTLSDADLGSKVKAKYPSEYGQFTDMPAPDQIEQTRAAFEAQPRMSALEKLGAAAKSMFVDPVIGLKSSAEDAFQYLTDHNAWSRQRMDPSQARGIPGEMGSNPLADAQGNIIAAGLTMGPEAGARSAAIMDRLGVKPEPTAPAVPSPLEQAAPGFARKLAERVAKKVPGVKHALMAADIVSELRDMLAEQKAKPPAAAYQPTPTTGPPKPYETGVLRPVAPSAAPVGESPTPVAAEPVAAAPEPPAAVATPVVRGKGMKQANLDAQALTETLQKWGFSPDEAYSMNRKGWEKAAFEAGIPAPTAAVQANALFGLKKALQGPNRTAGQLISDFKKAGRK